MENRPSRAPFPRWLILIFFGWAMWVRSTAVELRKERLTEDPDEYAYSAFRLLVDGQFFQTPPNHPRSWRNDPERLRAWRPPLYPLVVAASRYFDDSRTLLGALQAICGAATATLVLVIAPRWGLNRAASFVAAMFVLFDPMLLKQSAEVMTETLATLLATLALWALTRTGERANTLSALGCGAMLALCVLCRPTFMLWLVACGVALVAQAPMRRRLITAFLFAVGIVGVLSPWAIRNWLIFDRPVITTTHGGYTFLMANNPSYYEHLRTSGWRTPWRNDIQPVPTDQQWLPTDELAADKIYYGDAWRNIAAEPGMFAWACVVRVMRLWDICPLALEDPEPPRAMWLRYAIACGYAIELALTLVGLWFLGRRLLETPWLWGLLLVASFTAVHTFYWADMRMRAPLMSVVALAAAAGFAELAAQVVARRAIAVSRQTANIS